MSGIWVLLSLVFTCIAGPLSKGDDAQVTDPDSEMVKLNITKRESECPEGQHREGQFCCQPCPPGKRKHADCASPGGAPQCVPCSEGEDYTDKNHHSSKCRRCRVCDGEHGLEVEKTVPGPRIPSADVNQTFSVTLLNVNTVTLAPRVNMESLRIAHQPATPNAEKCSNLQDPDLTYTGYGPS